MSANAKRLLVAISISIMVVAAIGLDDRTYALKAPHDSTGGITTCNQCHSRTGAGFKTISSFNNLCFNNIGCHRTDSSLSSRKKAFNRRMASNRFGSLPANYSTTKQVSHGWKIPSTNSDAGVPTGNSGLIGLGSAENIRAKGNKIYCTRCHRAMGTSAIHTIYDKFLRADPTGNYICYQCHSARRIDNVREPLESSGLHYSHPVEVNYSTAVAKAYTRWATTDFYETTPKLASAFGYKTSASVRLYTTHNTAAAPYGGSSRLAGSNKGAVVCQTCHGPIHSADSNPYTFDNLSAYSRLGQYSTSQGNLLRMYPIAGSRASDNLCQSCHKVKVHETNYPGLPTNYFTCGRCHTPHKKAGEANRYLILENISTLYNGIRPVYFVSTSAMAKRYGAGTGEDSTTAKSLMGGYSSTIGLSRLDKNRTTSSAICQVCHTRTKYQRNYSSPNHTRTGGGSTGHELVYDSSSGKYRFCAECHAHNLGFIPGGEAACGSCHYAPPFDRYSSDQSATVIGKHGKHVKKADGSSSGASYNWGNGTLDDARSADAYGFSCGRCHSPYANYSDSQHKPADPLGVYSADVGFDIAANASLPKNPYGTFTRGTRGSRNDPGSQPTDGVSWSVPGAGGGTCRNLYCHGQFYNGYTSNDPTFTGDQICGKCHGAKRSDPPGKTAGVNWGAHPRHVGNANNQQYNSAGWKFGCSACHYPTVQASVTSIDHRGSHVNGRVNVDFNGGGYGNAASTYGGFAGYTSRTPAFSNPFSDSKPAYKTCNLIYCHSDGSRTQGNYSSGTPYNSLAIQPNWSSSRNFTTTVSGTKRRCARCHGNSTYKGITAAMPGYLTRAGKGNSHDKHIQNGFLCRVCHSATVNADNKSIASTTNHVNAFYNITILSAYKTGQTGYSSTVSAKKTCKNLKCHAGKTTPLWGSAAKCQNCHLSNTGDTDKRILARSKFTGFTSAAPKIYSTQWANVGHGKATGNYTSSRAVPDRNPGANKVCTDCHSASVKHGTADNPFRLYTAPAGNPNRVCEGCHGTNPWVGGGASKQGIQTHASSITATGRHSFAMKCIDCHDPHGDNNRFMLHSTLPAPNNPERKSVGSGKYGIVTSISINRNVDFVNDRYTSDYGKKVKADKVCQVCHRRTYNPEYAPYTTRFRYYSSKDAKHGSTKCTSCHYHTSGFKGAGCNNCHGAPPTGLQNILSGLSNPIRGKRASGSTTAGAHFKHYTIFSYLQGDTVSVVCSKCHQGGMYGSGQESGDIELGFKAFNDYTGSQTYGGQSGVNAGYYGYSGEGISYNGSMRCTVKCHGGGNWLTASYGTPTAPRWDTPATAKCGKCHGAKRGAGAGSWPISMRHEKHAGYPSGTGYDFMCRFCHADTVMGTATTLNRTNHVNGQATFKFYTGAFTGNRIYGQSAYNGGDTKVNSGFGRCEDLYCHSRGTTVDPPYTGSAYPNYTAKWETNFAVSPWADDPNSKCSFCHGSKASAGGYAGITSAMPNQADQAHKKHVVDNGFKCYVCHSATVNSGNAIVSTTNHVNKFKNISIVMTYRSGGQTMYSSSLSATNKTCKNIKCHAGRKTPNWTTSTGINCSDCHYQSSGAAGSEDNFAWTNFSGTAAKIYSTEWAKRGHGRSGSSYPFSGNSGAGKTCTNCHSATKAKHGDSSNYFRLRTSISDRLCAACHGTGTELNSWGIGQSNVTGIQTHSWANISTAGYNGGIIKAASRGGWNFTPKCVDCHDPHGDKNNYMVHSYINMSGSNSLGRPTATQPQDTNLMNFTAVGGPQMNWSSYVRSDYKGICQRCHSDMMSGTTSIMDNFNKSKFSLHNVGNRCTNCHKHKQGFKPSGCTGCHASPPPNGPSGWNDSMTGYSSLHTPHAQNPRSRPINGKDASGNPSSDGSWQCAYCHDDKNANNQAADNMDTGKNVANLNNMTSQNGYNGYSPRAKFTSTVNKNTADDKCSNVGCHTPRAYQRQWKKPTDCDDCHGYRNKNNLSFNVQTTNAHKIHVSYTTAGYDRKKYGLACSNCHYDWQGLNNYSTHYSSYVNITANGPVNTKGGQFYGRGRSFKGFSTGGELNNDTNVTCSKVYCHGNFTNGTTTNVPKWRKGAMSTTCGSCHKAKTAKVSGWADGSLMPESHPKHEGTAQYNFACARCHVRTVTNNTTVQFNWSSHVNGRKDVYFNTATTVDAGRKFTVNNTAATLGGANRACKNAYCHSRGTDRVAPYNTRTSFANFTAKWGDDRGGYRKAAGQKAKCNYCHGNKAYSGMTSAMPNYSGTLGVGYGVTAKANSHRVHVVVNGFVCSTCHNSIILNHTGISDRTRHANGFYNISITPLNRRNTGTKVYSMVYDGTGGTCMNNTCHGASNPKWGDPSTANCKACHFAGKDKDDYWRDNGVKAELYSSEWKKRGHGQFASFTSNADNRCVRCHDQSVGHKTATNPYRLKASESGTLCLGCHGSAAEKAAAGWNIAGVTNVDYKSHTKANAQNGAPASWNTHTSAQGKGVKCIDCHDPHGDKNRKMIQSFINHSGSDEYGRPAGPPSWSTMNYSTAAMMTFTTWGSAQPIWSSFANNNVSRSICRRCHTTGDPGFAAVNMTKNNLVADHNRGTRCPSCHTHNTGFKPGGESTGGQQCGNCHSLYSNMQSTNTFHHVMMNDYTAFKNITLFDGSKLFDSARRCLMCHVDHDNFSPKVKAGRKRASNLRVSASLTNVTTGINTDFWPAKRKNQVRTGGDMGTANYSSTYPVSGPAGYNGVCISCHKNVQTKNTTWQKEDATSKARPFPVSLYTSSSHNFQVISGFNNFSGGSSFRANCSKCHRSNYVDKSGDKGQLNSRFQFGLHDRNTPSLLNVTSPDSKPKIEQLCYKCHSQTLRDDGGPGTQYDYYSSVKMNSGAKLIRMGIEGKPTSGHAVDDPDMAGLHKIDEKYNKAPASYNYSRSGSQGGPGSGWNRPGANRHVECVDCHNTHGGNASILRRLGTNEISGAQKGVWGVKYNYTPELGSKTQPTYSTIDNITMQYQLCLKCHSAYAYYTAFPATPSGAPARSLTSGDWDYSAPETDVGMDFSPNAHGYHPVIAQGRNQPPIDANTNWPVAGTMKYYDYQDEQIKFAGRSGFDYNFVPPFGRKATLACSDCHRADTSGNAAGAADAFNAYSTGGWTMPNGTADVSVYNDGKYAQPNAGTQMTLGVFVKKQAPESSSLNSAEVVLYGKSTGTSTNNRKITISAKRLGTVVNIDGAATKIIALTSSNARYTGVLATTPANWLELTDGTTWGVEAIKATNVNEPDLMFIDYLGIAGMYKTTGTLRGPHGSLQKWILVDLDRKNVRFDSDQDGTIGNTAWDVPNSTYPSGYGGSADAYKTAADFIKTFCFNCHRRDVYGAEVDADDTFDGEVQSTNPKGKYARITHPGEGQAADSSLNFSGIFCLNCHGSGVYNNTAGGTGDSTRRKNNLHGSFANRTIYNTNAAGFRAVINRPKGVRLLNGAANVGIDVPTTYTWSPSTLSYIGNITCYTRDASDSLSSCTNHGGAGAAATVEWNYTYTSW